MDTTSLVIGMILFNGFTALDLFGPHEVFSWMPNSEVVILSEDGKAVRSESGVSVNADASFEKAPQLDLIFVPGGSGVNDLLKNKKTLEFIKQKGLKAKYISSVCTGALVLGACGLLKGYRATTHWASMDFLKDLGATAVQERFVVDRNRFTGGGVTAGIDLALKIVNEIYGKEEAQAIQLMLEYNPQPEFKLAGSPQTADPKVVERVKKELQSLLEKRRKAVLEAASKL